MAKKEWDEEEEKDEKEKGVVKAQVMPIDMSPTLDDIIGEAKNFTNDFQIFKKGAGIYDSMGINAPSTFLLEGEPGTGKSMSIKALNNSNNLPVMAKSLIGEQFTTADFNLMVFEYSIGKHGTAYINMGSKIVQSYFDQVHAIARFGIPVLVFIDEADALLGSRKGNVQTHSEDRKVLETIMKNLQVAHDTPNFYVALASNIAEQCDSASLRAGRIDRKYHFKLPTAEERILGYEHFIKDVNNKAGYKVVRKYNAQNLAEISKGFNYADIKQSVTDGIESRATELIQAKKKGIITAGYITQNKLEQAVNKHSKNFKKSKIHNRKIGFNQ
jgi:SpoVK/Ycf46/Vps4 family AAA+-type ATPase